MKNNIKMLLVSGMSSLLLAACNSDIDQIPPGSTVVIAAEQIAWSIPPVDPLVGCSDLVYQQQTLSFSVQDENGTPLGGVELRVTLDQASNTFPGTIPAMKLYDDFNGNGIVDEPEEYVSDTLDPVYVTETDEYTGVKFLTVRVNTSCPHTSNIHAFSGAAYGSIAATVTVIDEEEEVVP